MSGKTPPEVNSILKNGGGYYNGCMMNSTKASQLLGIQYDGRTNSKPNFTCIAETNHYKSSGYPQHFFVLFPDGKINCPILGERIKNPYNIVSYRLFHERNHMGKVLWDHNTEVIFSKEQADELKRKIGQENNYNYTGNESWGFISGLAVYAEGEYAKLEKIISDASILAELEKGKLSKANSKIDRISSLYENAVDAKKEAVEDKEKAEDLLEICKATKPVICRDLLDVISDWWKNIFNKKGKK